MAKGKSPTPKQEKFCLKYIECSNATEAYKHAYNVSKMLPATINRKATELMATGTISARVAELKAKLEEKFIGNAEYVLTELSAIAAMTVADILNDDLTIKPLREWPQVWKTSISAIDVQELRAGMQDPDAATAFIKKLKWPDKIKTLEVLGKHVDVQAYSEKIENTHKFDGETAEELRSKLDVLLSKVKK